MNYFDLFDIPVGFKIDREKLNKKYFELQKKYHPDFFTQSSEVEQTEALEKSSQINKAYKIFKTREETIKYILQQKGLLEAEEKYQLPPDFLMEVMQLNEELSENSAEQIKNFEKDIYAGVETIIENYEDANSSPSDLLKVKEYYYKKKYLQRILDRIKG